MLDASVTFARIVMLNSIAGSTFVQRNRNPDESLYKLRQFTTLFC